MPHRHPCDQGVTAQLEECNAGYSRVRCDRVDPTRESAGYPSSSGSQMQKREPLPSLLST